MTGRWRCPACDREFARVRQSHVCVPGCTVDECFAGRPAGQRAIYDAVAAYMTTLGPVHVDAVGVGVFLKHVDKFAEIRPRARSVALWLVLPRPVEHDRIARRDRTSSDRVAHMVKLTAVEDIDDELKGWLTEAYHAASG